MGWMKSATYTIDRSADSTDLVDFPVLIKLDHTDATQAGIIALCQSAGQDIRFYDSLGVALSHEIDTWGTDCYIHVKLPSIPAGAVTTFYMYYGNPSCADGQNAADVWSNGFAAVYHMNDLTTSTIKDSLGVNDGAKKAANEPVEAAGSIGKAQSFDGSDDRITMPDFGLLIAGAWSIEGVISPNAVATAQTIYARRAGNDRVMVWIDGGYLRYETFNGTVFTTKGGAISVGVSAFAVTNNNNTLTLAINGNAVTETVGAATINSGATHLGSNATALYYPGLIDELRLSSVARSAEWIADTYKTLMTPATYAELGAIKDYRRITVSYDPNAPVSFAFRAKPFSQLMAERSGVYPAVWRRQ